MSQQKGLAKPELGHWEKSAVGLWYVALVGGVVNCVSCFFSTVPLTRQGMDLESAFASFFLYGVAASTVLVEAVSNRLTLKTAVLPVALLHVIVYLAIIWLLNHWKTCTEFLYPSKNISDDNIHWNTLPVFDHVEVHGMWKQYAA